MADITLSSAVRSNLNTLQQTASFMSDVQNKLATGKKVNSALDNPNSFFTASGLTARANDLSTLLDDMGQSVQTLKAADEGISSITNLVESAKAKANQALQSQSQYERKQFASQYNELLTQIEDLAKDAGYKGKNLLAGDGNDLRTIFNEDSTSKLDIESVDYTDASLSTGLNLSDLTEGAGGATNATFAGGKVVVSLTDGSSALNSSSALSDASNITAGAVITISENTSTTGVISGSTTSATGTVQDLVDNLNALDGVRAEFDESTGDLTIYGNDDISVSRLAVQTSTATLGGFTATDFTAGSTLVDSAGFAVGDTITLTDGNNFELGSFEIESDTTLDDLVDFVDDFQGVTASIGSNGRVSITSEVDLTLSSERDSTTNSDFNTTTAGSAGASATVAATDSGFASDSDINTTISRLNTALSNLRSQASEFGTNLSIVENRQDFTQNLINTLEEGAGKLTLADTNEEGANLLALQTRQSLASTSLSFAAQADQNVLRLF